MIFSINSGLFFGSNWHTLFVPVGVLFIFLWVIFQYLAMYIFRCVMPRCEYNQQNLAQLEFPMTALKERTTQIFNGIEIPLGIEGTDWEKTISCLLDRDKLEALEQNYKSCDASAQIECDRNHVLRLVDEIAEFAKTRRFPELLLVMREACDKINDFHDKYSVSLSGPVQHVDVFKVLFDSYSVFEGSLDSLEEAVQFLNEKSNSPGKSKHRLEKAADMYDTIAFELKDHARFLSARILVKLINSAKKLRDSMVDDLNAVGRQKESQYKSKRRIWVASCTIIMFLEDILKESMEDVGIFEDTAEACSVMNVSSESEYRDFLADLGDDW